MTGLLPTNENERNYMEEIRAALARSGQETSQPQEGSYQPISRSDYPLRNRGKMGLMSEVPPVIEAMGKAGLPITLRGTSKGVGLYAGDETEPIHRTTPEGKTEPYYVASAPPPPPPPPAPEVNTVERVNADFAKRQEKYLLDKRNQAAIIQKGYQLNYSSKQIEEVLKSKNLHKLEEPKHSSWEEEILKSDLKRQEEERKEKAKTEESPKPTAFQKEIEKKEAQDFVVERGKAQDAAYSFQNLQTLKELSKNMFTGSAANMRLTLNKWAQESGYGTLTDIEKVSNTEAFSATAGKLVGKIIKEFGAGTGLSDADREYAEKIVGGKVTLSAESIAKVLNIAERANRGYLESYNKKAAQVMERAGQNIPYSLEIPVPSTGVRKYNPATGRIE